MNVSNHAATGAIIAIAFKEPAIALPLAFASHFALDAVPHFGYKGNGGFTEFFKHKLTYFVLVLEFIAWVFLVFLLHAQPAVVILAALIATSPDLVWLYRYFGFERRGVEPPAIGKLSHLHSILNWCERPWGILVELVWFSGAIFLLQRLT